MRGHVSQSVYTEVSGFPAILPRALDISQSYDAYVHIDRASRVQKGQSVYLVVSHIGGPPVPYETGEMVPRVQKGWQFAKRVANCAHGCMGQAEVHAVDDMRAIRTPAY